MEKELKLLFPIFLVLLYTGLLFWASNFVKNKDVLLLQKHPYLSFQLNYQALILLIALLSLLTSYFQNSTAFSTYFSIGNISAPAETLPFFGINQGDSWLKTGISLCIVISLATGTFMYFQLKKEVVDCSILQQGIVWILLFSLTNSFAEEMIYRIGIIAPLKDSFSPMTLMLISAILFGIPHLAGMPNGILGATMAGILGFVLAKSVIETNGIFWAWLIHFLQDIIIISVMYLTSKN